MCVVFIATKKLSIYFSAGHQMYGTGMRVRLFYARQTSHTILRRMWSWMGPTR
jgi:hypothetical protein